MLLDSNTMHIQDTLAYLAGSLGCIASLPQFIKIMKRKKTRDISLSTLVLFIISGGMWESWGIMLQSPPIIITNGISLLLNIAILITKIRLDYCAQKQNDTKIDDEGIDNDQEVLIHKV